MKKLVRIMGLCALVALAFSSCKKNETTTQTFKASTVQLTADSKTHLNNNKAKVLWDLNNEITVFDQSGQYRSFVAGTLESNGQTAVFHVYDSDSEFMSHLDENGYYSAFYPNTSLEGSDVKLSIPAMQTFAGDNFADNSFPMVGRNVDGVFSFMSDAGVLALQLNGNGVNIDIDSLVICAKNATDTIAGNMIYNYSGVYSGFEQTSSSISVARRPASGGSFQTIQIPGGDGAYQFFTFILPKDALRNGFYVRGYAGENADGPIKIFEKEAKGDGSCTIIAQSVRFMDPLVL